MKENDLLLGRFAEKALTSLDEGSLFLYEELLKVEDQKLFTWLTGQELSPPRFQDLVGKIMMTLSSKD